MKKDLSLLMNEPSEILSQEPDSKDAYIARLEARLRQELEDAVDFFLNEADGPLYSADEINEIMAKLKKPQS